MWQGLGCRQRSVIEQGTLSDRKDRAEPACQTDSRSQCSRLPQGVSLCAGKIFTQAQQRSPPVFV